MKGFISGAVLAALTLTAQAGELRGRTMAPNGRSGPILLQRRHHWARMLRCWDWMVRYCVRGRTAGPVWWGIRGQPPKEVGAARIRQCPSVPTTWG